MTKTGWIILGICLCLVICLCVGLFLSERIASALFADQDVFANTKNFKDLKNPYSADGAYSVKVNDLKELSIDWISGSVIVELTDSDIIRIQETASRKIAEKDALRYGVSGSKLRIQACKKNYTLKIPNKDLIVSLPRSLADKLQECEINSVSASVSVHGLTLDELEVNTVSGNVSVSEMITDEADIETVSGSVSLLDSSAESLRIDTVSGIVKVSGCVKSIKLFSFSGSIACNVDDCKSILASTISGPVDLVLPKTPKELNIGTTSGEIRIALPTDASCLIQLNAMSGKLYLNNEAVGSKQLTLGDGAADFDIDSMSGSVYIRTN